MEHGKGNMENVALQMQGSAISHKCCYGEVQC